MHTAWASRDTRRLGLPSHIPLNELAHIPPIRHRD